MSLPLLHLANHYSTNIGNGALVHGTERVLAEDFGGPVRFTKVNWDDYSQGRADFDGPFVDRVERESAGLLIGAAVSLNGDRRFANAGMRFDLPYELWPALTKPVIFYAVSYRWDPRVQYQHIDKLRRAIEYVLANSRMLFSVRNDGTKAWLESLLGFRSERIVAIPDPALYVPTESRSHVELEDGAANVLISLNNEDERLRFASAAERSGAASRVPAAVAAVRDRLAGARRSWRGLSDVKLHLLKSLVHVVETISRTRRVNLILCPHYFFDFKIMEEFLSLCPWRVAHEMTVCAGVPRAGHAPAFYDLYAKADVALSMRVHSMTPAVGLGTPFVALMSDPRMAAFLADSGLSEFGVDILDRDLAERTIRLVEDALEHRDQIRRRLCAVRAALRQRTRAFNGQVAALVG